MTSHGFALNANTDLSYFDLIVPCGIKNCKVTSIERETGRAVDLREARRAVVETFGEVFGLEMVEEGGEPRHA